MDIQNLRSVDPNTRAALERLIGEAREWLDAVSCLGATDEGFLFEAMDIDLNLLVEVFLTLDLDLSIRYKGGNEWIPCSKL